MKVAFIIDRNLYYKFFGPVIQGLLDQGHEVILCHKYSPRELESFHHKVFYYPFLSQVPSFKGSPSTFLYDNHETLSRIFQREGVTDVFSLMSRGFYQIQGPYKWSVVQHGIDNFKEKNFDADHLFVYSRAWMQPSFKAPPKTKIVEVGQYYVQSEILNREKISSKYNLDPSKKYIMFVPLPDASPKAYKFLGSGVVHYLKMTKLLKEEARLIEQLSSQLKPYGYELLIKSRFKRFMKSDFAKVFYDESFYPSTVGELTYICEKVLINFMPGAFITEAMTLKKDYLFVSYSHYHEEVLSYSDNYIANIFLPQGKVDKIIRHSDVSQIVERLIDPTPYSNDEYRKKYLLPEGAEGVKTILRTLNS